METEDNIVQEDLDNRSLSYRDIYDKLNKYTDDFTIPSGQFPVKDKYELESAEDILKNYYENVEKPGLDYDRVEIDGVDYKIRFSNPLPFHESFPAFNTNVFDSLVEDNFETSYKKQFIEYCNGKVENNLGSVNVTVDDYRETLPVKMIGSTKGYKDLRITDKGQTVYGVNNKNKTVVKFIDKNKMPYYTGMCTFTKILKSHYQDIINNWGPLGMDHIVEQIHE